MNKPISICQWCFEAPPAKGHVICQACIDSGKSEYYSLDLDKFLEEEDE